MSRLMVVLTAGVAMAFAAVAHGEPLVGVTDPTPDGAFTGEYRTGQPDDPETAEDESRATQQGYIGVYADGVVACNGDPELGSETGLQLVGYIWLGSGKRAETVLIQDPTGNVGAGNNHTDADGNPSGNSPCPDADPDGVDE